MSKDATPRKRNETAKSEQSQAVFCNIRAISVPSGHTSQPTARICLNEVISLRRNGLIDENKFLIRVILYINCSSGNLWNK